MVIEVTDQISKVKQPATEQTVIAVIGLGYVGLPLTRAFSQHFKVFGFDMDVNKVKMINSSNHRKFTATCDADCLRQADFIIIAVPTPVTKSKEPDLSYVISATKTAAQFMKPGCTVVLESTVYPGVTEEVVKPILEESGRICGKDFYLAYCPERINPGDNERTIDKSVKVIGGFDPDTTNAVAQIYSSICSGVFKAKNIKTAEAAKVIENVQRDLNIALVNELSLIFERLGINTRDVLDAASTKWNFHRYSPGMVGGHCIPVDPYYLVRKAREVGYEARVILSGRNINDYMPLHVAQMTVKGLNDVGKVIKGSKVLLMGLTYKENVADTRETPVKETIRELNHYGVVIYGLDPLIDDITAEFGIHAVNSLSELNGIDSTVLCVGHDTFRQTSLDALKNIMNPNPVLVDVRGFFNAEDATNKGFYYKTL